MLHKSKNNLPKDWSWIKLGDVCEKVETVKRKAVNPENKLIYIDIGGIDNEANRILSHKTYKWKDAPSRAQQIIQRNDILLSTVRTYIKNIALVEDPLYDRQIASSGFCVIRGNPKLIQPKFLFYYILSQNFLRPLNELQTGSSYPAVRDSDVFSQSFPLPPKPIQQAIVSKIEELFSELDKGIENLRLAQQQLKTYRQSVLKWAFEGRLTNDNLKEGVLPEGWTTKEIREVCDNIKVGIVVKPTNFYSKTGSGIKAFRSANVKEFKIWDFDWVYFTEAANEMNSRTKLKEGDVLLVRSGYPGTSCVVSKQFAGSNAIDILIASPNKDTISGSYLCAFNNSPLGKGMFRKQSRGVAQKHLNVGEYSKLKVNLPSLKEQLNIILEIERRFSVATKLEENINQSLEQAEALRQSILKKAFEGTLASK